MIRNGAVSYQSKRHLLQSWRPESELIFILLTALISTLLSYQASSIILDVSFGLKRRGIANFSDIHIHHLVHRMSPQAVVRALFPKGDTKITSAAVREIGIDETASPANEKIHVSIVLKLILLLFVAPVMNTISIFLTTEYDTTLTFSDAKFSGIRLGVKDNLFPVRPRKLGPDVYQINIEKEDSDTLMVSISIWLAETTTVVAPLTKAGLLQISQDEISIGIKFTAPGISVSTVVVGEVNFLEGDLAEKQYLLTAGGNFSELGMLLEYSTGVLKRLCNLREGEVFPIVKKSEPQEILVQRAHNCTSDRLSPEGVRNLFQAILEEVTVVNLPDTNSDLLLVNKKIFDAIVQEADVSNNPVAAPDISKAVENAGQFQFLKRKQSYVGIPLLSILLLILFGLRFITSMVTNNDLGNATSFIVHNELNIPWCDSMLASGDRKVR